jgi:hypothetical protein
MVLAVAGEAGMDEEAVAVVWSEEVAAADTWVLIDDLVAMHWLPSVAGRNSEREGVPEVVAFTLHRALARGRIVEARVSCIAIDSCSCYSE